MYAHLLLTVVHQVPSGDLVSNRYCVSFSLDDPLFCNFDVDRWAEPEMRKILMRTLCEDWACNALGITGCEEVAGAVQWGERFTPATE
jgi:hypothetical protein